MSNGTNKSYPQPHCPNCGTTLRLITENNKWYCDNCKIYPKTSLELSKIKNIGTKEGNRKFWIYYILIFFVIIGER